MPVTGPVSQHADPKAVLAKQCSEGPRTPTEDLSKTPLFVPRRSIDGVLFASCYLPLPAA